MTYNVFSGTLNPTHYHYHCRVMLPWTGGQTGVGCAPNKPPPRRRRDSRRATIARSGSVARLS